MVYFIFGVVTIAFAIFLWLGISYEKNMDKMLLPNTKWTESDSEDPFNAPYAIVKETRKNVNGMLWVRYEKYNAHNIFVGNYKTKASIFLFEHTLIEEPNEKK